MLSPIQKRYLRSVYRRQNRQIKKCTWRHASSNVDIFRRSSPPLMGSWVWRRRLTWKGCPDASQQSGSSPTSGHADTSRVGFPSRWCGPHTGAYGGPGFQRTKLAYSIRSGRTAPGSTFSYRRVGRSPDLAKPPTLPTPHIHRSWRSNPEQQSQREHQKASSRT